MNATTRKLLAATPLPLLLMAVLLQASLSAMAGEVSGYVSVLSPEEEAKTFVCEDGYKMELVLADPIIKEPVVTVFDGNGRMYVAEMCSYMQDADGKGQSIHNGRVSVHWSSKKNGVYDKHAVFVDNLFLPRMILPLADGVVINETDTDDFYLYKDTKGDGVADSKTLFFHGPGRGGNMEHQPGGIIYDMDNHIYMPVNNYRLKIKGTNVISETTPANFGQWGLCQDDFGKPWFMNAGYESGAVSWLVPVIYGAFGIQEQYIDNEPVVWPLIGLGDAEGGAARIREKEKSLNHYSCCCGDEIYRGNRLPMDLNGDLLFCEPVGRIIRRDHVVMVDNHPGVKNAYKESEWIRSYDPLFRPVNLANAPDGSIYVTDMYRGVIQEKDWTHEGSYLRTVINKYNLGQVVGHGRIWRITHPGFKPAPQPELINESSARLARQIANPIGWWRDTAQRLLVLRGDKSVAPYLVNMVKTSRELLPRVQALWTLEGLDCLKSDFVLPCLKDPNPKMRMTAIRIAEDLYRAGDASVARELGKMIEDSDPEVVLQAMFTAKLLNYPGAQTLINAKVARSDSAGFKLMCDRLVAAPSAQDNVGLVSQILKNPDYKHYSDQDKKVHAAGETVYNQICFACHGMDGKGTPMAGGAKGATLAPSFSGAPGVTGYSDTTISAVLKGLSGPVSGKNYTSVMAPMENNSDEWLASVVSYIRSSFGNHASMVTAEDIARVRSETKDRHEPWTLAQLNGIAPVLLTEKNKWTLSSSHNPGGLHFAVDNDLSTGYDTQASQVPGMWVQVTLPESADVCGVQLDAGPDGTGCPRSYKVEVSNDGLAWSRTVAEGKSPASFNQILFNPVDTRYIRITQTGLDPKEHWVIKELNLLRHPTIAETLAATAAASSPAPAAGKSLE